MSDNVEVQHVITYPKIGNDRKAFEKLVKPEQHVVVQEKRDGSNVGIVRTKTGFYLQSHHQIINPFNPGMFEPFVKWATGENQPRIIAFMDTFDLPVGSVLYGEMVNNQGKVKYPNGAHWPFEWFDTFDGMKFVYPPDVFDIGPMGMGARGVNTYYSGPLGGWWGSHAEEWTNKNLEAHADTMEGYVIKAYNVPFSYWLSDDTTEAGATEYHKTLPLVGLKVVAEGYRERRTGTSPQVGAGEVTSAIAEMFVTPARIDKARLRLQESGIVDPQPHQIIKSVQGDISEEEMVAMREALWIANRKGVMNAIAQKVLSASRGDAS